MMRAIPAASDSTREAQQSGGSPASKRAGLSFEQTVPCGLAHRTALGEVFVADSLQSGDDEFLVAVQIPRAHSLWFDRRAPYHDPLATAEAVRQGMFVVIHRHVGLPRGIPFSLQRFGFQVHDVDAYRDNETSPLNGIVTLRVTRRDRPRTGIGSITFEGELAIDAKMAMTVTGYSVFLPKSRYETLRDDQRAHKPREAGRLPRPRPIDPALVGRFDPRNVVIGDPLVATDEVRCPLVVDTRHPSFFDHQYDHVPGPLMAEAYRQIAIVAATRAGALSTPVAAITACEASFSQFAEFDATIECSASVSHVSDGGRVTLSAGLHQLGSQISEGRVELSPYP